MSSHDWLDDAAKVPIECPACGNLTSLIGDLNDPTMMQDLCDCGVPLRVYVGDAPPEAAARLEMLLDLLQTPGLLDTLAKAAYEDLAQKDLEE